MQTSPQVLPLRLQLLIASLVLAALSLIASTASPAAAAPRIASDPTVVATFNVTATTYWGQNLYVVGGASELGSWNPDKAVPLSSANYPTWTGTVLLAANSRQEFKYLIKNPNGTLTWERGPNRTTVTPPTGTYITHDDFRF
ncbi:carbohydrate-binding module family 20 domain-containing protein [Streptomyces sp. NPDC006733]|uniref:carbohydrate-binding module family 20 domain-containing protein n=1 Tax=Streptomyces sp. NPDC006733 TaxID=3155460 RepID=UPI0033F7C1CC